MLDIKINKNDSVKYLPVGGFLGLILFVEIVVAIYGCFKNNPYKNNPEIMSNNYVNWFLNIDSINDINALGQIIYTHFVLQFLVAGLILLLAIVSVVSLTKNVNKIHPRKQSLFKQISRGSSHISR